VGGSVQAGEKYDAPYLKCPVVGRVTHLLQKYVTHSYLATKFIGGISVPLWNEVIHSLKCKYIPSGQISGWIGSLDRFLSGPLDRHPDRPLDRFPDRPLDRLADRPLDRLLDRPLDRFLDWPLDRLQDRSLDKLPDKSLNRLPNRPLDRLPDRSLDILADRPLNMWSTRPTCISALTPPPRQSIFITVLQPVFIAYEIMPIVQIVY